MAVLSGEVAFSDGHSVPWWDPGYAEALFPATRRGRSRSRRWRAEDSRGRKWAPFPGTRRGRSRSRRRRAEDSRGRKWALVPATRRGRSRSRRRRAEDSRGRKWALFPATRRGRSRSRRRRAEDSRGRKGGVAEPRGSVVGSGQAGGGDGVDAAFLAAAAAVQERLHLLLHPLSEKDHRALAGEVAARASAQPLLFSFEVPAAEQGKLLNVANWFIDSSRDGVLRGHDRASTVAAVLEKTKRLARGHVTLSAVRCGRETLRNRFSRSLAFARGGAAVEEGRYLFTGWKLVAALALRNEPAGLSFEHVSDYATQIAKRAAARSRSLPWRKQQLALSVAAECNLLTFGSAPLCTEWQTVRREVIEVEIFSSVCCALKEARPRERRRPATLATKAHAAKKLGRAPAVDT